MGVVFHKMSNISYSTLTAFVTKNPKERVEMGSYLFSFILAPLASLIILCCLRLRKKIEDCGEENNMNILVLNRSPILWKCINYGGYKHVSLFIRAFFI